MTKTLALILTIAACGTDDPTGTVNDPRAVLCDTFRVAGYQALRPSRVCYFDVSDLDWAMGPFSDPTPAVLYGCSGTDCPGGAGGSGYVDPVTYKTGAVSWTGDTEYGVAVVIGEFSDPELMCIWKRCTRTE